MSFPLSGFMLYKNGISFTNMCVSGKWQRLEWNPWVTHKGLVVWNFEVFFVASLRLCYHKYVAHKRLKADVWLSFPKRWMTPWQGYAFRITGPLWVEPISHSQRASNMERWCFLVGRLTKRIPVMGHHDRVGYKSLLPPHFTMRQLFGDVTMGQWRHN